jgi:hypothetical protein
MAVVFVLGPGMWDPAHRPAADPTPIQIRRGMAKTLVQYGHAAILMEEDPDRKGEDVIQKFDRLLRAKVTDVLL